MPQTQRRKQYTFFFALPSCQGLVLGAHWWESLEFLKSKIKVGSVSLKEKKFFFERLVALKAVTLGPLLIITTFHGSWFEVYIK